MGSTCPTNVSAPDPTGEEDHSGHASQTLDDVFPNAGTEMDTLDLGGWNGCEETSKEWQRCSNVGTMLSAAAEKGSARTDLGAPKTQHVACCSHPLGLFGAVCCVPNPTAELAQQFQEADAAGVVPATGILTGHCQGYEGQLVDGVRHGHGRLVKKDGSVYEGGFVEGMAQGHGVLTSSASTYVGQWRNDHKDGEGLETCSDETRYEGEFVKGQRHGKGRFSWPSPDDCTYDGAFENGSVSGEGEFTWKDGRKYTGQWHDNKMHGQGKYTWPDQRFYKGQYVADMKHGHGTFSWPDGQYYVGQWEHGQQHGAGLLYADGETIRGRWERGKMFPTV